VRLPHQGLSRGHPPLGTDQLTGDQIGTASSDDHCDRSRMTCWQERHDGIVADPEMTRTMNLQAR